MLKNALTQGAQSIVTAKRHMQSVEKSLDLPNIRQEIITLDVEENQMRKVLSRLEKGQIPLDVEDHLNALASRIAGLQAKSGLSSGFASKFWHSIKRFWS